MLSLVEVRTEQGLLLSLPIYDPSGGLLIQDIEGLDPVDAMLSYSSIAGQDDEEEQSAKRVKRNIILTVGYEPDYVDTSVKSLRDTLYGFFMPKSRVKLRFYFDDDMPTVEIEGRVEKFNSPLFVKDPEAKISIICRKSNFYALTTETIPGETTSGSTELEHEYEGTIETGGLFRITPNRSMSQFTIYNRLPDDSVLQQDFVFPLINGDILEINSVPLSKYARLTRAGATTSVLYGISPYSKWLNLFPGVNRLRIGATGAAVPWSFQYVNKYGGL